MARVICLGLLGPDDPIYHGGVQLFSHRLHRPRAEEAATKEVEEPGAPPEGAAPERAAPDETSQDDSTRPDEPEDERSPR